MARQKLKLLRERRDHLWTALLEDESQARTCRLVVPGTVYPGVEVSIGKSSLIVDTIRSNVVFRLRDEFVAILPYNPDPDADPDPDA
jgi:uncharacterized protein (DUF342 family)